MSQSEEVIKYAKDDKGLRKTFPAKTYFLSLCAGIYSLIW